MGDKLSDGASEHRSAHHEHKSSKKRRVSAGAAQDAPEKDNMGSVTKKIKSGTSMLNGVHSITDSSTSAQTSDIGTETREERKKRKEAKKEAKRAKKEKRMLDGDQTDSVLDQEGTSTYSEHLDLSVLSQSAIDTYLEENFISTVTGSSPRRRPAIQFSYLSPTPEERNMFKDYASPTPIQASTWPYLLAGSDVVGVAETGSGKTLAYGVPLVRYVVKMKAQGGGNKIRAVVVSPTRELALQIHGQLEALVSGTKINCVCIYGGMPKEEQRTQLKRSSIVIATPGRLNDFIQEGSADLSNAGFVVLDEADRMLEKGFEEEVRKIIGTTADTNVRQTAMFTATWPPSIRELAASFMSNPVRVNIGDNSDGELRANARVTQQVEVIDPHDKQTRLLQILKKHHSGSSGKRDRVLVFCLYKKEATRVEGFLRSKGFHVGGIHGDMNQRARMESLEAFRSGQVPLLIATDVAARGLDIPAVKLVVNVTFPLTAEDYVHRIGRTGRAGKEGLAITLFTEHEKALSGALINVLKAANQSVPPELFKFGTTVKKKTHPTFGAFYKDTSDMPQNNTKITFD